MTLYWFAQAVGGLAFLVGITTFFNRNERRFKLQLALYSLIIGLHFFIIGRECRRHERRAKYAAHVGFHAHPQCLGHAGIYRFNAGARFAESPLWGRITADRRYGGSTWALFRCRGLTTRCVMRCSTACWVTHNIWLGSIGSLLIEGSFLIMNGLAIVRFHRLIKQGIDPFIRENRVLPVQLPGR